jgi:flagellar operon protein
MDALSRIQALTAGNGPAGQRAAQKTAGPAFADVLREKVTGLTFSAHAQARVKSRNIELTPQLMDKLTNAVDSAQRKGSNNSLVLFSNAAFIVNIPNRTVVTAMDGENIRENIFTNIDSTVIAG